MQWRNSVRPSRTMSSSAQGSADDLQREARACFSRIQQHPQGFPSIMRRAFARVSSGAFLTPYSTWNLQTRFGLPPWPISGAGQGIGGTAHQSDVDVARLTKACRRQPPASARASLPLPAAPDARRLASKLQPNLFLAILQDRRKTP